MLTITATPHNPPKEWKLAAEDVVIRNDKKLSDAESHRVGKPIVIVNRVIDAKTFSGTVMVPTATLRRGQVVDDFDITCFDRYFGTITIEQT